MITARDTIVLLNCKLRLLLGHFKVLMPLNQQAKKGITMLAGVIGPDYQGEINCSPVEVRKDICIIQKIPQSVSEYYHTL